MSPSRAATTAFRNSWRTGALKGPQPRDLSKKHVHAVWHCQTGIIEVMDFGAGNTLNLWVESKDLTLSFAPWPVCNPRLQAPTLP